MLLEGGLKWQPLSLTPADMDFIALRAAAAREIALAFGVPPVLLGLPGDATYANYREANRALWRQAILPLAGKILDALAQALRPWFKDLELTVDLDRVPALSEDRERLWVQLEGAGFLTVNEKREAAGFAALAEVVTPAPEAPKTPPATKNDEAGPVEAEEVKFNPWHDPEDGQFTFAGQGIRSGDAGTARGRSGQTNAPGAKLAAKPRPERVPRYFSASTPPTIDNAVAQIKTSKFGKTKAGRFVIDKIERLHQAGKISIADLPPQNGKRVRGLRTPNGIVIDTSMADHVSRLASELVHEATHDMLSDEYARTGRRPNGNSIEQEALTNGYQLRLYREQRKYSFSDKELERRLEASNRGKLSDDIRKRYPKIPQQQPAK